MLPKSFSGLMLLLFIAAEVYPQLNEFIITPQPAPAVIPVFTSHPDKAAIIIYSSVDNITFDSNTDGIVKIMTDEISGTYTLIVYPERQFIKVKKRGFLEGLMNIPPIEQRQVLYYKIEPKTENENTIPVTILSEPEGADIYIDDEFKGSGTTYKLPAGTHKIKASKGGYGNNEITVEVSEQNVYFNIKLEVQKLHVLTIRSVPENATVFINEQEEGKTNLQVFKTTGVYKVRLALSGYLPIDTTITVNEGSLKDLSFTLIKNEGILVVTVLPSHAEIFLNDVSEGKGGDSINIYCVMFQDYAHLHGKEKSIYEEYKTKEEADKRVAELLLAYIFQFMEMPKYEVLTKKLQSLDKFKISKQPGEYKIRILASGYLSAEDKVTLGLGQSIERKYELIKNSGVAVFRLSPSDALLKINNKEYPGNKEIDLAPGSYQVIITKKGYLDVSEMIDISRGQKIERAVNLQPKTGILVLSVKPIEAAGELKYEGRTVKTFTGSQYYQDLLEGEYELNLKAAGHKSYKQTINIKYNETTKHTAQLTPGSDVPAGFVFVQGGTFQMGSYNGDDYEKPVHSVTVSDFFIAKYEVTQALWKSVMGNNPSNFTGDDNLPVEQVSWYDAVEFCNKLSEKEGLQKVYSGSGNNITMNMNSNGYRLPTEAEWEYASRGGSLSKGYTYSGSNNAGDVAWYNDNSNSKTHPVGEKQPNELGIYDMSGNVWEWCWDWYGNYSSASQTNPVGPSSGSYRVNRGGCWYVGAGYIRPAVRGNGLPDDRYLYLGFRLVRSDSQ